MSLTTPSLAGLAIRRPAPLQAGSELVSIAPWDNPSGLPALVTPVARGVDPFAWAGANRERITQLLHRHGGILLRGFGLRGDQDFQRMLDAVGVALMHYIEKATPREQVSKHVYTSTIFPPEHPIAPHNELSYVRQWPGRIAFFCEVAPQVDGETPLVDVRRVLARIDPEVAGKFRRLGWMLVRNFGSGIGPSWQHSLAVKTREQAEAYLRRSATEWRWLEGGAAGNSRLRTFQRRAAVRRHPVTNEELWFNHIAFWHPSGVPDDVRRSLEADFGTDNLPYNTLYGDGSEIPLEVAAHLRATYDAETVKFRWQEGDLLLLDNMLVAHGRSSYSGQRRVLTAMGDEVRPASVQPGEEEMQ
ncbi:TauD/TfdA family dioxygenase [Caenimonas terrae]|uniref:TauD/TfdA family dioxygenase n=1 Tax=Caenimonas terrae TaxID=696074 RepID=A0ABW0NDR3_9BURK